MQQLALHLNKATFADVIATARRQLDWQLSEKS
jgi:hypothetical protein